MGAAVLATDPAAAAAAAAVFCSTTNTAPVHIIKIYILYFDSKFCSPWIVSNS